MLYLLTNQMTAILPHHQGLCWVTWRRSSSEADKSGLESLPSVGRTRGTVVSKHCLASTNEWTFAKPHGCRWQERQWGNVSPWNGNLLYFVELLWSLASLCLGHCPLHCLLGRALWHSAQAQPRARDSAAVSCVSMLAADEAAYRRLQSVGSRVRQANPSDLSAQTEFRVVY